MSTEADVGRTRWDAISVRLHSGKEAKVVIDTIIGIYAVHKRVWDSEARGPGWSVTHVPSGCAIWTVDFEVDALKVARVLDEGTEIPRDSVAFQDWRVTLSGASRARLIAWLANIAPRYDPNA